jgi:uncharacterized membrane protein YraQ (UPF0718 family)
MSMYGELVNIAGTAGRILAELWWFVALAIIIASVMSTLKLDKKVAQFFHRARGWAIAGALLLGLVSPL